jgi:hypothetical protein
LAYATAGATALSVLLIAGTATARWSTTATGTGSAATSSGFSALTTTAVTASGALLYPGGAAAPLTLQISNPNGFPVKVTGLSLDGSRSISASGGIGTCANAALSVSASGWAGVTIPANGNSGTITVAGAVSMGAGADNGCQGATFTIPVTLSGSN